MTSTPTLTPSASSALSLLPNLPQSAGVLVVRLRSIGDIVLTLPAISALHAWRPDLRIGMLVERAFAPLLEGNPAISDVVIRGKFWPTAANVRSRRFAVAYNMHGGPSSAWLTRFSGAPVRVSWTNQPFAFFYRVQAPPLAPIEGPTIHTAEHRAQQFFWTGLPAKPLPPATVYPQPDAIAAVQQKLAQRGIAPGTPYAVLRPGGSHATKRWPAERFGEFARWLRETHGFAVVVNLGPGDEPIAPEVRSHLGENAILDGLDLRQLIALLAGARLFVGNDTGPTHIAAALGRLCIAIFGSSHASIWHPWKTEHRLLQNAYPCSQCPQGRCPTFAESRCIFTIGVDQARDACNDLLAERSTTAREA